MKTQPDLPSDDIRKFGFSKSQSGSSWRGLIVATDASNRDGLRCVTNGSGYQPGYAVQGQRNPRICVALGLSQLCEWFFSSERTKHSCLPIAHRSCYTDSGSPSFLEIRCARSEDQIPRRKCRCGPNLAVIALRQVRSLLRSSPTVRDDLECQPAIEAGPSHVEIAFSGQSAKMNAIPNGD